MTTSSKLALSLLLTLGIVLAARQGGRALNPALPKDMPSNAHFVQSGYNLQRNEPVGDWVACNSGDDQGTNFCRVTDTHGMVIYQGEFVAVNSQRPVTRANLRFAAHDPKNLWVRGPAEEGPVPAIPLADGQLLVPVSDSAALAERWARDPDELARLEAQ